MLNGLEHTAILSHFFTFISGSSSRLLRIRFSADLTMYWFPVYHFRCKEFNPFVIWIWNQNIAISTIVGTSSHNILYWVVVHLIEIWDHWRIFELTNYSHRYSLQFVFRLVTTSLSSENKTIKSRIFEELYIPIFYSDFLIYRWWLRYLYNFFFCRYKVFELILIYVTTSVSRKINTSCIKFKIMTQRYIQHRWSLGYIWGLTFYFHVENMSTLFHLKGRFGEIKLV